MRHSLWLALLVALAALAACTDGKTSAPSASQDREVRDANRLPDQQARAMASPYQGLGCLWPISLEPARIAAPNALTATCQGMPQGRPYEILINARIPAALGEGSGIVMRLSLEAAGRSQELAVRYERRIGDKALFSAKTAGQVPNGGAVPIRLGLIGCVDAGGASRPCILDGGALFVLSRN